MNMLLLLALLSIPAAAEEPVSAQEQFDRGATAFRANDCPAAMGWFQKAAAQGLPIAEESIGELYADGCGVTRDDKKAFEWFQRAADHGFGEAMSHLGRMYANGVGVEQDIPKAIEWYEKSGALGKSVAFLELGTLYSERGEREKALKAWLHAADMGLSMALVNAGEYYRTSYPPDYAKAREYFTKAAEAGDPVGDFALGSMISHGQGEKRDIERSLTHFRRAAGLGVAEAMPYLATQYEVGQGTRTDRVEAYAWYSLSAERGEPTAFADMRRLRKTMSSAEIDRAVKRARSLGATIPKTLRLVPGAYQHPDDKPNLFEKPPAAKADPTAGYDPSRDAELDIVRAASRAKTEGKRVLVIVGGAWCHWCYRMDEFMRENPDVTALRDRNFISLKVYSGPGAHNPALSRFPSYRGIPHLFVLDGNGDLLQSKITDELEAGESYDREKFLEFLREASPPRSP